MKKFFFNLMKIFEHDPYAATVAAMKAEKFSQADIDRVVERMKYDDWAAMQW